MHVHGNIYEQKKADPRGQPSIIFRVRLEYLLYGLLEVVGLGCGYILTRAGRATEVGLSAFAAVATTVILAVTASAVSTATVITTVASPALAILTLGTGPALRLYISLGLLGECAH